MHTGYLFIDLISKIDTSAYINICNHNCINIIKFLLKL